MRSERPPALLALLLSGCFGAAAALPADAVCYEYCPDGSCAPSVDQRGACDAGLGCALELPSASLARFSCSPSFCPADAVNLPGNAVFTSGGCQAGALVRAGAACTVRCGGAAGDVSVACSAQGWASASPCIIASAGPPGEDDGGQTRVWVVTAACLAAGLLALGLGYWLYRRRRDTHARAGTSGSDSTDSDPPPPKPKPGKQTSPPPPPAKRGSKRAAVLKRLSPLLGLSMKTPAPQLVSALKGSPQRPRPLSPKGVTFSEFQPGDVVDALYRGKWLAAAIKSHDADGTYTVVWLPEKKTTSRGLPGSHLRGSPHRWSLPSTTEYTSTYDSYSYNNENGGGHGFEAGGRPGSTPKRVRAAAPVPADQPLQCLWQNAWHNGFLEDVNSDGTYVIRWLDGTYTPNMDPTDTKFT
ncbi:hypothetical protein DIPPA_33300 [Diplonema papillatum]|nr:hypothetical protein DIPPA_33300 [Diplonema papillatum]